MSGICETACDGRAAAAKTGTCTALCAIRVGADKTNNPMLTALSFCAEHAAISHFRSDPFSSPIAQSGISSCV